MRISLLNEQGVLKDKQSMKLLSPFFEAQEIEEDLRNLDFETLATGTGIYYAAPYLCFMDNKQRRFEILPQGFVRYIFFAESIPLEDDATSYGPEFRRHEYYFVLSTGQWFNYTVPLQHPDQEIITRDNISLVIEKQKRLQLRFHEIFRERFAEFKEDDRQFYFVYSQKKQALEDAFIENQKLRTKQEILTHFQEFLPTKIFQQDKEEAAQIKAEQKRILEKNSRFWVIWFVLFSLNAYNEIIGNSAYYSSLRSFAKPAYLVITAFLILKYIYEIIFILRQRFTAARAEKDAGFWQKGWLIWNCKPWYSIVFRILVVAFFAYTYFYLASLLR